MLELLAPFAPYVALLLRVLLGANLLIHASPKLGRGTPQTVQWVKSMGLPAGAAYSAIGLELFGGIFLLVGFLVPVVAVLVSVEMVANSVMKKSKMSASYIAQSKPSYELDVLYLLLSLVLLVLGPGVLSIDSLIGF